MAVLDPTITPFAATFLFVFAVVFGLLTYSKVGEFSKRINAIIAAAIAAFSVLYEPLVLGLQSILPLGVILLIILFFIVFLKKLFSKEKENTFPIMLSLGILLVVLIVLGDAVAGFLPASFDLTTAQWIIGIIVVLLFFYAAWYAKAPAQA